MKKIKNILIILIICIILISIAIVVINKRTPKNLRTDEVEADSGIRILNDNLEVLNIRNRYFVVQNIIKDYYQLLCNLNVKGTSEQEDSTYISKEEQIQITKKKLLSYFDKGFIDSKQLTLNNMKDVLGNYNDLYVDIQSVKFIESEELVVYFVNGQIIEKETKKIENFTLMLVIDSQNLTFNLYTENYIKEKKWNNFSKETFNSIGYIKIDNRIYNKYSYNIISDEIYCNTLLESYINRLKYNTEFLYNVLDKNYKQNKFKSIEEYKEYVKNINTNGVWLTEYNVKKSENGKEFICIDNKERMWIFYEKTVMNYDVILDTYTIDLPEFLESYNKANMQEKTALNIQKIVNALNDQDYKYVYSKLANSFKQENFKTLESFETYAKKTFGVDNKLEFLTYEKTNNYTIYKINLTNNNLVITKTIIMDIQEGTDFVFSFNVD